MRLARFAFCTCVCLFACAAQAADVETVVVTASALPGTSLDPDQLALTTQTLSSADLSRLGAASVLRSLSDLGAGLSIADAQDNPFQPNIYYRGFEASPLAGDAQGLAVYANGVRLNQPFGDAVNWDLLPDLAIDSMTVESANPVFGLNALGGSISLQMKSGFTWEGAEAEALAGSLGRAETSMQWGHSDGPQSVYLAATAQNDDGWRDHSPSHLAKAFADFGWRSSIAELHLDLLGAATGLTGNGPAPVQLLARDRTAVFTFPDKTNNRYGLANLFGTVQLSPAVALQGNIYTSRFRQSTRNGDASEAEPCRADELCLEDGVVITDAGGNPIPDFLKAGTYGQLDATATDTLAFGGSVQASDKQRLFGLENQLIAGIAYDGGRTDFAAQSQLGALSVARRFLGPAITMHTANGEITPVHVTSGNDYFGLYAADLFRLSPQLSVNFSARLNEARLELEDRLGAVLNGSHSFEHFNPATGLTYRLAPVVTLYAGYAEANRAPTPAELSCASATAPCSLTNFFVADPALKQVLAQTIEAGARGQLQHDEITLRWHAEGYRVDVQDDVLFAASPVIGRGFFRNIGETRRQGFELSGDAKYGAWLASFSYAFTDATFRSPVTLNSPDNPHADGTGEIHVGPGNRLPAIPRELVKMNLGYRPGDLWNFAVSARYAGGQYLRGDESNLNPTTRPYIVFDLSGEYRLSREFSVFAGIENLLGAKYETFGTFAPVDRVPIVGLPKIDNPRSLSPGTPFAGFAGVRAWL